MQEAIRHAINEVLKNLGIIGVNFVVDYPTDKKTQADFFSNAAMSAARLEAVDGSEYTGTKIKTTQVIGGNLSKNELWNNPSKLAELIKDKLENKIPNIEKIEVAGPGFLNFYVDASFYTDQLKTILEEGDSWGHNQSWAGKKVLVEYTDPNPFKEFHIGHLFTNAVGESIARLFMMNGANTKRVNYQGDVGMHVAKAIWGLKEMKLSSSDTITIKDLGKAYSEGDKAEIASSSFSIEMRIINKIIYEGVNTKLGAVLQDYYDKQWHVDFSPSEVLRLYEKGRQLSLEYFETIYKLVGTKFDEYFFESEAGPRGKELVLNNPNIFPESDGARIFDGEARGLHTRVFLNKEGLPTYEAKELALAKIKEERFGSYDHSVISTANEINEYFKVLLCAMGEVYPELAAKTEHIGHGMVRLTTGKMSSRTGDVIPAIDFIQEVAAAAFEKMKESSGNAEMEIATDIAIGAIKYATLRGSILQDTTFDKDRALSFEGDSGPYLQYTHARICSVLEKAAMAGVVASTEIAPAEPYVVQKLLIRFPSVIATALHERAPHKVATYLTELAGAFNSFYAVEKIADANDEYAPFKAAVTDAVRTTLKNGLWVLGIKAPERM